MEWRSWWNQPDHFAWMTNFLRDRSLLRPAQRVMATVTASSLLVPAAALLLRPRPSVTELILDLAAATFIAGVTVFWLTRWPTRRQSRITAVTGALCIAVFALMQPSAELAAQAPAALAVIGAYVAFFHGARMVLLNVVVAVVIAMVVTARLAGQTGAATAVAIFWLVVFLNAAIPAGIGALSLAMRTYAVRAQEDPLTGLLNRRGFTDTVTAALADTRSPRDHLAVMMVDLDDFKRINDDRGHAAGDDVLVSVAEVLRRDAPGGAVVCRCGGEEFLIAAPLTVTDAESLATRLCSAIAELPAQITASIGVAGVTGVGGRDPGAVERLIAAADTAMYAAKRFGGNRFHRV